MDCVAVSGAASQMSGLSISRHSRAAKISRYSFIHDREVHFSLDRIKGVLLGVGIGDALGLPAEIFSREQIAKQFGVLKSYESLESNRFFRGKGKLPGDVSDDFHLSHAIACALSRTGCFCMEEIAREHVALAKAEPYGFGGTTMDAIKRYESGVPWTESGKTDSPKRGNGNGIPMKVGPVAVYHAIRGSTREEVIKSIVDLCAFTHATPMSVSAGLAQTFGIMYCLGVEPHEFKKEEFMRAVIEGSRAGDAYFQPALVKGDITSRFDLIASSGKMEIAEIIEKFGKGSCFVFDSLPFTLAFFVRDPHSINSLIDVINAGGDTDTNGAMLGALLGALHGRAVFPHHLLKGLRVRRQALKDAVGLWKLGKGGVQS